MSRTIMSHTLTRRATLKGLLGLTAGVAVSGLTFSAHAQSLQDLRASGAIGEGADGFAVVRQSAPGAQAVVDATNAQRRSIYVSRAGEQGVSAAQVGSVYAASIFAKSPPGTWFVSASGAWSQK